MVIAIAHLETTNFDFAGYGKDAEEAEKVLRQEFTRHMANRYGSLTWDDVAEDVWVETVRVGTAVVR